MTDAAAGVHSGAWERGAAWPIVVRAQQPAMPVIGWLDAVPGSMERSLPLFTQGLAETGSIMRADAGDLTAGSAVLRTADDFAYRLDRENRDVQTNLLHRKRYRHLRNSVEPVVDSSTDNIC
jgi:hypothetical protein